MTYIYKDKIADYCEQHNMVYLPKGDAFATRRARQYSDTTVDVVRYNGYGNVKVGILADVKAVERAIAESEATRDERKRKAAEAQMRFEQRFGEAIREQFPQCPAGCADEIVARACSKGSRRVGRSAMGRALNPDAIRWAVGAHIRHNHTAYEMLLEQAKAEARYLAVDREDYYEEMDRAYEEIRDEVYPEVQALLAEWAGEVVELDAGGIEL